MIDNIEKFSINKIGDSGKIVKFEKGIKICTKKNKSDANF